MALPTYIWRSTDTGAPTMSGQAGVGGTLLDALLQNGYNAQTGVTVARTGTVATFTKTAHGYRGGPGCIIQTSAFAVANFNVLGLAFNVTANTWDMTVANSGATSDTGGASKVAPAPWSLVLSGSNIRTYRQGAGSNQLYLGVDDSNSQNTRLRGFETAPAAAGVTEPTTFADFPLESQVAGGLYWFKSSTANATTRSWVAFSNGKIFYFLCSHSGVTTTGVGWCFGDVFSRRAGDAWNTILIADSSASSTLASIRFSNCSNLLGGPTGGHYLARGYTGVGGSLNATKYIDNGRTAGAAELGAGGATYPHPVSSGLAMIPCAITDSAAAFGVRGILPGIYCPLHNRPLAHGDTFSGKAGGLYDSRTFETFNMGNGAQVVFETTQDWFVPGP